MQNKNFINKIICADTLKTLPKLENDSIDVVLTDSPYFLDKLDNKPELPFCKKVEFKQKQILITILDS